MFARADCWIGSLCKALQSDPKQQVDMACLPCDHPVGQWSPTRDLASCVTATHAAPRRNFSPRSGTH